MVATRAWPADLGKLVRLLRIEADHFRRDFQRHRGHRQHPALGAQQLGHHLQSCDRIAEALPEAGDQEVANGVIIQGTRAPEPVLQHVGPGAPGLVIAAQRRQRHPEVARRQAVELLAESARRPAVVSDGDDCRQMVRHPTQGGQ